jgi:hypothetical protein
LEVEFGVTMCLFKRRKEEFGVTMCLFKRRKEEFGVTMCRPEADLEGGRRKYFVHHPSNLPTATHRTSTLKIPKS